MKNLGMFFSFKICLLIINHGLIQQKVSLNFETIRFARDNLRNLARRESGRSPHLGEGICNFFIDYGGGSLFNIRSCGICCHCGRYR